MYYVEQRAACSELSRGRKKWKNDALIFLRRPYLARKNSQERKEEDEEEEKGNGESLANIVTGT